MRSYGTKAGGKGKNENLPLLPGLAFSGGKCNETGEGGMRGLKMFWAAMLEMQKSRNTSSLEYI